VEKNKPEESQDLESDLAIQIPDRDYTEYLIETIKLTVKKEDSLVRQIVYTVLSKDTQDPLNLAVIAPTSEGKTYAVHQTLQYFPHRDIRMVGSMSPRVIIRDTGILVDSDNQPIAGRVKELKRKIREASSGSGSKTEKDKKASSGKDKLPDKEDLEEEL